MVGELGDVQKIADYNKTCPVQRVIAAEHDDLACEGRLLDDPRPPEVALAAIESVITAPCVLPLLHRSNASQAKRFFRGSLALILRQARLSKTFLHSGTLVDPEKPWIRILLPQPDDHLSRARVDIAHQQNLQRFLPSVCLVDTESIDPHRSKTALSGIPHKPVEHIEEVFADLQHLVRTTSDIVIVAGGRDDVNFRVIVLLCVRYSPCV